MATPTRQDIALRKFILYINKSKSRRQVLLFARLLYTDTGGYRYFANPNFDRYIEAIPGTYASEQEKKYEGINSWQYVIQRLTATY